METDPVVFKNLLDQGLTPFQIATKCEVIEPLVRKKLHLGNPDLDGCTEWLRRVEYESDIELIDRELSELYEAKFITPEHTSELISALITATDSRKILELGMYSGFTTLHMIKAIIGKEGAHVTSVDCRPAHDREFFDDLSKWFTFIEGWTPGCLSQLAGTIFDLVFVDSSHGVEHSELEVQALMPITRPGSLFLFHDVPKKPDNVYRWLENKVQDGTFKGLVVPTAAQQDVDRIFGPNNQDHRPNLGVFIRP